MGPGSQGLSAAETVMVEFTEVVGMMKAIISSSKYIYIYISWLVNQPPPNVPPQK